MGGRKRKSSQALAAVLVVAGALLAPAVAGAAQGDEEASRTARAIDRVAITGQGIVRTAEDGPGDPRLAVIEVPVAPLTSPTPAHIPPHQRPREFFVLIDWGDESDEIRATVEPTGASRPSPSGRSTLYEYVVRGNHVHRAAGVYTVGFDVREGAQFGDDNAETTLRFTSQLSVSDPPPGPSTSTFHVPADLDIMQGSGHVPGSGAAVFAGCMPASCRVTRIPFPGLSAPAREDVQIPVRIVDESATSRRAPFDDYAAPFYEGSVIVLAGATQPVYLRGAGGGAQLLQDALPVGVLVRSIPLPPRSFRIDFGTPSSSGVVLSRTSMRVTLRQQPPPDTTPAVGQFPGERSSFLSYSPPADSVPSCADGGQPTRIAPSSSAMSFVGCFERFVRASGRAVHVARGAVRINGLIVATRATNASRAFALPDCTGECPLARTRLNAAAIWVDEHGSGSWGTTAPYDVNFRRLRTQGAPLKRIDARARTLTRAGSALFAEDVGRLLAGYFGFNISGVEIRAQQGGARGSTVTIEVGLPDAFFSEDFGNVFRGSSTVEVPEEGGESLEGLSLSLLDNLVLGGVFNFPNLTLSYNDPEAMCGSRTCASVFGGNVWTGTANVTIPGAADSSRGLGLTVAIQDNVPVYIGGEGRYDPGYGIKPPILFLTAARLELGLRINPLVTLVGGGVRIAGGPSLPAVGALINWDVDGRLLFRRDRFEASFSGGQSLFGIIAMNEARVDFMQRYDRSGTLVSVDAALQRYSTPLFEYAARIRGAIDHDLNFLLEGGALFLVRLGGFEYNVASANAVFSNVGWALCGDLFNGRYRPGVHQRGYRPFRESPPDFTLHCDLGPYRHMPAPRQADVALRTVAVPPGQDVVALRVRGHGGPPPVRIAGPGGLSVEARESVVRSDAAVHLDEATQTTTVVVPRPRPGSYRIESLAGSTAIAAVERSVGTSPAVIASVRRTRTGARVLSWRARGLQAADRLVFTDTGPRSARRLVVTSRASGTRTFRPDAGGHGGAHRIAVTVERDRRPILRRTVARYKAPLNRLRPVRGLRATRRGGTVTVQFRTPAGRGRPDRYRVTLIRGDRVEQVRVVRGRSLRFTRVPSSVGARVRVRPILGSADSPGPAASTTVRQGPAPRR